MSADAVIGTNPDFSARGVCVEGRANRQGGDRHEPVGAVLTAIGLAGFSGAACALLIAVETAPTSCGFDGSRAPRGNLSLTLCVAAGLGWAGLAQERWGRSHAVRGNAQELA